MAEWNARPSPPLSNAPISPMLPVSGPPLQGVLSQGQLFAGFAGHFQAFILWWNFFFPVWRTHRIWDCGSRLPPPARLPCCSLGCGAEPPRGLCAVRAVLRGTRCAPPPRGSAPPPPPQRRWRGGSSHGNDRDGWGTRSRAPCIHGATRTTRTSQWGWSSMPSGGRGGGGGARVRQRIRRRVGATVVLGG